MASATAASTRRLKNEGHEGSYKLILNQFIETKSDLLSLVVKSFSRVLSLALCYSWVFLYEHFDRITLFKSCLPALIRLLTVPIKTRGQVFILASSSSFLRNLPTNPYPQDVSSPCELYELLRASTPRFFASKIRTQKNVFQPRGQRQSASGEGRACGGV